VDGFIIIEICSYRYKHTQDSNAVTMATSSDMSTSEEMNKIRTLLNAQSYSTSMIQPLEDYLSRMCAGTSPYMFDAVRTLIKLYTLFPSNDSIRKNKILDNMGLACLLALTYGSANRDIITLRFMIPTTYVPKDNVNVVSQVFHCAALYDSASFVDFWMSYTTSFVNDITSKLTTELDTTIQQLAKASIPTLQRSILLVLSGTYQQAPMAIVVQALNVTDMKDVTAQNPDIIVSNDTDTVTFISTCDNTQRHRSFQENINYSTVSNLMYNQIKTMAQQ
jgi:hypothetical protein